MKRARPWRPPWWGYLIASGLIAIFEFILNSSSALYLAVAVGSAAATVLGLWGRGLGRRSPWIPIAVGVGLWAFGDVLWTGWAWLVGEPPFPFVADVSYLAGYLLIGIGVVWLSRQSGRDRYATVDTIILAAAAVGALFYSVTSAAFDTPGTLLAKAVAIGYPLASLGLFACCARLWLVEGERSVSIGLLSVGLLGQLIADAVYAGQSLSGTYDGGLLDLGWLAAYTCIGAAALHPSISRRPRRRRSSVSLTSRRIVLLACASCAPIIGWWLFDLPLSLTVALTVALGVVCTMRVAIPVGQLRRASRCDQLTGLLNRIAILDELDEHLATEANTDVAVLYCDLDRFKMINDGFGHAAGDEVLVTVAARMRRLVPPDGSLARLAGDEFLIVLPGWSREEADLLAYEIISVVAAPIAAEGVELRVSMSVGVAVERDVDPEALVRFADLAMYAAKSGGRGRVEHATAGAEVRVRERLRLSTELPAAIASGAIAPLFQPEVNLLDGSLFGVEALARWNTDDGVVPPDVFIPVAEESGAIDALFDRILDATLQQRAEWQTSANHDVAVSVNVSPKQLELDLVARVRSALDRRGAPASCLWLEVTESSAVERATSAATLDALRALGVRLAVDDFGTGTSSLSRLANFTWDAIKIDRSFVDRILVDERAHNLVAATVAMAKALGTITIAEGVETVEHLEALRRLGCDVAQGYLFARPLDGDDAQQWITRNARSSVTPG